MISLHVNGKWTLLFAFLFHMPVYCRTWIILPAIEENGNCRSGSDKRLYAFIGFTKKVVLKEKSYVQSQHEKSYKNYVAFRMMKL